MIIIVALLAASTLIFITIQISSTGFSTTSKNGFEQQVNSSYPVENTPQYVLPSLGPEPSAVINDKVQIASSSFATQLSNPTFSTLISIIVASSEMRQTNEQNMPPTFWLTDDQSFSGLLLLEPHFSYGKSEDDFAFKALLDGQEIKLGVENAELLQTVTFHLKHFERKTVRFRTEPLTKGSHTLSFLIFSNIYNDNLDASARQGLGRNAFSYYLYRTYVGANNPSQDISFLNWSVSSNLQGFRNTFVVNEGKIAEDGTIPIWTPKPFKASEEAKYTVLMNNPDATDREYCFVALLDYKQIPIQGKSQICGILQAKTFGKFSSLFETPSQRGNHQFQVIRIENPLLKVSYYKAVKPLLGLQIDTSIRSLIQVS